MVYRSYGPEVSYAKGVLMNLPKFREKHLRCRLFFFATLLKIENLTETFSSEVCEILKNTFCIEHLWATASVYPNDDISSNKACCLCRFLQFSTNSRSYVTALLNWNFLLLTQMYTDIYPMHYLDLGSLY